MVIFFLHPNNTHDVIDQRLILINDSSKAVKERHGYKLQLEKVSYYTVK